MTERPPPAPPVAGVLEEGTSGLYHTSWLPEVNHSHRQLLQEWIQGRDADLQLFLRESPSPIAAQTFSIPTHTRSGEVHGRWNREPLRPGRSLTNDRSADGGEKSGEIGRFENRMANHGSAAGMAAAFG